MMGILDVQSTPILALNLWEHAYWTDHGDVTSYLNAYWEAIDWKKVSDNFTQYNL